MNPPRNYSYDDQSAPYSPVDVAQQTGYTYSGVYPRYDQQGSQDYYLPSPTSNSHGHPDPRYRSSTPLVTHTHRYSRGSSGEPRYSSSSGGMSSSSNSTNHGYYSSSQYSSSQSSDRFIPTPSEIAHTYFNNQQISQSPGAYATAGHHPHSRHSRNPSSSPVLTSGRSSTTTRSSPTTERYPCEMCGKTFSRSHDRKRHHETQHIPCPVLHRCRYCRKEFSRADSLKRHLDNGCDEMPSAK